MRFLKFAIAGALLLATSSAIAQTSPGLTKGQVLTAGQWNQLFSSKQDTLGYTPLNQAGGIMTGRLVTAPPGSTTSSFNLTPGTTPAAPTNGDLWATTTGLFVRINGVTLGPLSSSTSASFAGTSPIGVTFPAGVVTYAFDFSVANIFTALQTFPSIAVAGSMLNTNIAAPGTPASGKVIVWADSTDTTIHAKNASGQIFTMVLPTSAVSNQFLTAIGSNGGVSLAQPSFANLSGTIAGGQVSGSYTGITGVGTLTAGATGAGFTVALSTSTFTGTLSGARLPFPAATILGGIFSKDCTSGGQFVQVLNTDGSVTCATPAGGGNVSNSGTPTSGQLAQWTSATVIQGLTYTSSAAWTPTDASGAGLTFTAVDAAYSQIGNMVFAYATLTYPSTANGSNALIGGLPIGVPNHEYARQCAITFMTKSGGGTIIPVIASTQLSPRDITGAVIPNSSLSLQSLRFNCIYPAT